MRWLSRRSRSGRWSRRSPLPGSASAPAGRPATTWMGWRHDGRTALLDSEPGDDGGVATDGVPAARALGDDGRASRDPGTARGRLCGVRRGVDAMEWRRILVAGGGEGTVRQSLGAARRLDALPGIRP